MHAVLVSSISSRDPFYSDRLFYSRMATIFYKIFAYIGEFFKRSFLWAARNLSNTVAVQIQQIPDKQLREYMFSLPRGDSRRIFFINACEFLGEVKGILLMKRSRGYRCFAKKLYQMRLFLRALTDEQFFALTKSQEQLSKVLRGQSFLRVINDDPEARQIQRLSGRALEDYLETLSIGDSRGKFYFGQSWSKNDRFALLKKIQGSREFADRLIGIAGFLSGLSDSQKQVLLSLREDQLISIFNPQTNSVNHSLIFGRIIRLAERRGPECLKLSGPLLVSLVEEYPYSWDNSIVDESIDTHLNSYLDPKLDVDCGILKSDSVFIAEE